MTDQATAPRLLEYLDYRQYLSDWIHFQKKHRTGFSLRSFAARVDLASASFLSAVLKGKKNLGEDVRLRIASAMGLVGEDGTYFHWLVQFNQAHSMENKNHYFRQLQMFRGSRARFVGEGQYRFYSKWFYAAVWNYFALKKQEHSSVAIAKRLLPAVSVAQVEEAIAVLLELGMVRKLANGYAPCENHWTTPPEVSSIAVKNHILELGRISGELLDVVPPAERQYNTLMFQVSPQGFETIKDRIRLFQEELRDILDHDQGEDRIYTLSMSLFPNLLVAPSKPRSRS